MTDAPAISPAANNEFLRLQAEARYARERYQLYALGLVSWMYTRPTDPTRMRELERVCQLAEKRLIHAKSHLPTTTTTIQGETHV